MNLINITTFINPFSFFCTLDDRSHHTEVFVDENLNKEFNSKSKTIVIDHGQYVAVKWNNNWTRGVISMESQLLIWLIDHGIYLRVNDKTVYINLPVEFKKSPTKVFEASICGVVPIDKDITDSCELKNVIATTWNKGVTEKTQTLLKSATKTYFIPITLLSTSYNDIVLGDLYLDIPERGIVNIIDELLKWPVFLERNEDAYIKNLPIYYKSRRKHRACLLKPILSNIALPTINFKTTIADYKAIIANVTTLEPSDCNISSPVGSTVVQYTTSDKPKKAKEKYTPTSADIEKFSHMSVDINGREHNVLTVLKNKMRDLKICDRYKDHDLKSIGRGVSRIRNA